jgi:hypothetical protein
MTNAHTLAEVKAQYGEKVFETGTSFVVKDYGKFRPNTLFVLDKGYYGRPAALNGATSRPAR